MEDFGAVLKALRIKKNLSRQDVADKMVEKGFPTTINVLGKWERNYSVPNVLQFFALCEILDVDDINKTFHIVEKVEPDAVLNAKGRAQVKEYIRLLSNDANYTIPDIII